jgi:hypothetical protein
MVNAHFLSNEDECYSLIKTNKILHYKIKMLNQQFNINFLSCLVWNESKKDFEIDVNSLIEFKKNYFRQVRPLYFDKLDKILIKALEVNDQNKIKEISLLKELLRNVTDLKFPKEVENIENFVPQVFIDIDSINI